MGVYLKEKQLKDIKDQDIQGWISFLKTPSPKGEGLSAKTVSRKLTALGNYFSWLAIGGVIVEQANPMRDIANSRITSPLPEILFEEECSRLLTAASADPRTYLLFFLLLETGIKLEELFNLRISHFDFSNKYSPEMYVKHIPTSNLFYASNDCTGNAYVEGPWLNDYIFRVGNATNEFAMVDTSIPPAVVSVHSFSDGNGCAAFFENEGNAYRANVIEPYNQPVNPLFHVKVE